MVRIVCRSREQHASRESDAGFTFVELVVALTILSVGIVGVIGVTNSSFKVASGASMRSKGVAVATREIEATRAIPYNEIGADRDGDGQPDCGTVTTTPSWSCYRPPTPTNYGGTTFTVSRTILDTTDRNTADSSPADKHKEVIVAVSWTDASGTHEVHQTSFIYPGGIGLATGVTAAPTPGNCEPNAPSGLTANQVTDLVNGVATLQFETALDLRWSMSTTGGCEPSGYVIKYRKVGTTTFHEVTRLATSREYRVPGLTAATTYEFQVFAMGPSGRLSSSYATATGTTGTASLNGCMIGTITVTPPGVSKKAANENSNLDMPSNTKPIVRMPVNGSCTSYRIVYKKTVSGTAVMQGMAFADGAYSAEVDPNGPWDVGSRFIDIVEVASSTKVGTVLFTVCEHQVSACGT